MHTAAIIIPRPPVISRSLNASIVVLLCASAPLPVFQRTRLRNHLSDWLLDSLPPKEQPEHLPENEFLRQQRHRHRKNQACHHCHECDHHLHNDSLRKFDLKLSATRIPPRLPRDISQRSPRSKLLNSLRYCPTPSDSP